MPNSEDGQSPSIRERIHRARISLHQRCPTWGHYCESACATGYAVHEVFHYSALLVPTAAGLLFVLVLRLITFTKGGF